MTRTRTSAGLLAVAVALLTTGCTPPQEHMALVRTPTVAGGAPVRVSLGSDLGPDMREIEHLELVAVPLVDRGSRQWDAMPSNAASARAVPTAGVTAHELVTEPLDLPPGEYAVWFRWGEDHGEHSDGYGVVTVAGQP